MEKQGVEIPQQILTQPGSSLQAEVPPLRRDAFHIAESPGAWLPSPGGVGPASLVTCSSLSQLITRKLRALPGRGTPDSSDMSGRHCYQNLVLSLHSPHILCSGALLPGLLLRAHTCCLWRFENLVWLSVLSGSLVGIGALDGSLYGWRGSPRTPLLRSPADPAQDWCETL